MNNKSFYGATKIAGEAMLRAFYHRYQLPYLGLRYMNVYGPRQRNDGNYSGVVTRMLSAIEAGEGPEIEGDGSQEFDFVHVTDCARANLDAMRSDRTDRFYNVGTGTKTSIRALAEKLIAMSACSSDIRYRPSRGPAMVKTRVGGTERARQEIGFAAQVALDDGLRHLLSNTRVHSAGGTQ